VLVKRSIIDTMQDDLFEGKAILLFGPWQVGKTTAMLELLQQQEKLFLHLNGDEADVIERLQKTTSTALRLLFGEHKLVFIDEAQRIPGIGITLKLITDVLKDVQVIATGSSGFDYPEIVNNPLKAIRNLTALANSYLYKDLLQLDSIKKPALLMKILKALALQVGSEVSTQEISRLVNADFHTVERYIDLLEKTFVIFSLPAWSGNVRNEIGKGGKYIFTTLVCGMRSSEIITRSGTELIPDRCGKISYLQNG